MDQIIMISCTVLAPLSVFSGAVLICSFWRLKQFKNHPEILIFWQCLSQMIFDLHWITGSDLVQSNLNVTGCIIIGAICVYFYFLSWNYTLLLTVEILFKIINPHREPPKKKMIVYQVSSHVICIILLALVLGSETSGVSVFSTCFVQKWAGYEIVIFLPVVVHFPICICIIIYTLYISYNTYYAEYLKYHMIVVVVFSVTWVPVGLVHGILFFNSEKSPEWVTCLTYLMGSSSGICVMIARFAQHGVIRHFCASIFLQKRAERESIEDVNRVSLIAPDILKRLDSYSLLFTKVKNEGIMNILIALANVLRVSNDCQTQSKNTREWIFSLYSTKKNVKVVQYNVEASEAIMRKYNITYEDILKSFELDENLGDFEKRYTAKGGKSGAFFYFSSDKEFILKSITHEELNVFNSIITSFKDRLLSEHGSYLAKVFGAYKFKFDGHSSTILLVMENLASKVTTPILFDLKGSSRNRRVKINPISSISDIPRNVVYKDIDFLENFHSFVIPIENFNKILMAIKEDTKMLMQNKIMDYSLLVIIEQTKSLKNTLIEKPYEMSNGDFVVFIGIIDFLQKFNLSKKFEHKYYSLKDSKNGDPSSLAPKPYRKRFFEMLKKVFTPDRLY